MENWNIKKCNCQHNLGEVCSICKTDTNNMVLSQNTTLQVLDKILEQIKDLEQSESSSYFTDAHIDGYNHALSDLKAIVNFERKIYIIKT